MSWPSYAMPRPLGPMRTPPAMSSTVSGSRRLGTLQEMSGAMKETATMHSRETKTALTSAPFLGDRDSATGMAGGGDDTQGPAAGPAGAPVPPPCRPRRRRASR